MSILYAELIRITRDAYFGKHYEPVKRNKDGMRWIRHRFPIKNGISRVDINVLNDRERLGSIREKLNT